MNGALEGKRVVITRPRLQADTMARGLRQHGATVILFPTIEIVPTTDTTPIDRAIDGLQDFDWIVFTSANGVSVFAERIEQRTHQLAFGDARIAAIGPATAEELERRGTKPHFVPSEFVADRIPEGMGNVAGMRVLLPTAARARKDLARELADRGAMVNDLAIYDTAAPEVDAKEMQELKRGVHVVTFTSSSSVERFMEITGARAPHILNNAVIACIGPITAKTADELGLQVGLVAERHTTDGIIEALVAYFADLQPSLADTGK